MVVPVTLLVGLAAVPSPAAAAAGLELKLTFDHGESLAAGSRVVDESGAGHDGRVLTGFGGSLAPVTGYGGTTSARFPGPCSATTCPKAVVEVPDAAGLDLDYAPFEWGTRLRLDADQTNKGQNLVQKGLYGDAAGQWKLQVDGNPGKPSCLVHGQRADGSSQRVVVLSSVSVADGASHKVFCRRTSSDVSIVVDGVVRGQEAMRPVQLTGQAPVDIGGKQVDNQDNDQFHGLLDDVVVRRI